MIHANQSWNKKYKDLSVINERIHSQNSEDGIIAGVFEACGTTNKYCVDIGAADGIWCSNVRNLILNYGWSALMVEYDGILQKYKTKEGKTAYRKTFPQLVENYKDNPKVSTLYKFITEDNIEGILNEFSVPKNFDLLNIDIDSNDLDIWKGIKKYRPNLVVIECNYDKVSLKDFYYDPADIKGGAGLGTLNELADQRGYDYLCVEMCNAFFIEREFSKPLLI